MDIGNLADNGILALLGLCLILISKGRIIPFFKEPEMASSALQKVIFWFGILIAISGFLELFGI